MKIQLLLNKSQTGNGPRPLSVLLPELWDFAFSFLDASSLANLVISGGLESDCAIVAQRGIMKRLKSLLTDKLGEDEEHLILFANQQLSNLERSLFGTATRIQCVLQCCILLAYLEHANLEDSRRLWPLAAGRLKNGVWTKDLLIMISSPLSWNPAVMTKLQEWLVQGRPLDLYCPDIRDCSIDHCVGLVESVAATDDHDFAWMDRNLGSDGVLHGLETGSDALFFLTSASRIIGNWPLRFQQGGRYDWLLSEKQVPGKNFVCSWGWHHNEFRQKGDYQPSEVLRMMQNLVVILCQQSFD